MPRVISKMVPYTINVLVVQLCLLSFSDAILRSPTVTESHRPPRGGGRALLMDRQNGDGGVPQAAAGGGNNNGQEPAAADGGAAAQPDVWDKVKDGLLWAYNAEKAETFKAGDWFSNAGDDQKVNEAGGERSTHVSSTKPVAPWKVYQFEEGKPQRLAYGLFGVTALGAILTGATHNNWFCGGLLHWSLMLFLTLLVFKYSSNYDVQSWKTASLTLCTATTMVAAALWIEAPASLPWTAGAFGASLTLLLTILLPRLMLLGIQYSRGDKLGGDICKFEVLTGFTILTAGLGFSATRACGIWAGQGYLLGLSFMLLLGLFLRHFIPLPAAGPNRTLVKGLSYLLVGTLTLPFAAAAFPPNPYAGWICATLLGAWLSFILIHRFTCGKGAPVQAAPVLG